MTVRPEIAGFLHDVKDHPDDDTPRLVLADWLQDQDDPAERDRGEFIRAQCLRMRLNESHPEHAGFVAREQQLLQRHTPAWVGPLYESAIPYRFQRGLLRLMIDAHALADDEYDFLEPHEVWSWVETVQLNGALPVLDGLAARLGGCQVPGLDLRGQQLDDFGLRRLLREGLPATLLQLDFGFCGLGVNGAVELAGMPLSALTTLRLEDNDLGDAGVRALAAGTHWTNLTTLNLRWNHVGDEGAAALASGTLPRLSTLYLGHNAVSAAGVTALLTAPSLPVLRTVYLEHNAISSREADGLQRRFGERVRF
jgi:uncharacterized protein (TIGR02996 family)